MNKKIKKIIITIVIVAAVLIIGNAATVVTRPGEYRVIRQFGKIVRVDTCDSHPYGLGFKIPFIQSDTSITNKLMLYDLEASDVMTSDKKSMISDCFVLWRIEDPTKFIQKLSGSQQNAESRISSNVYNALKNEMCIRDSYYAANLACPLCNTVFFMSVLCICFYHTEFIQNLAGQLGTAGVLAFVVAFVGVNGLTEAIVCFVVGSAVSRVLALVLRNTSVGEN